MRIDSLDVTILQRRRQGRRRSGRPSRASTLTGDTPEVLDFYARRSPYFMAAKFDAHAPRSRRASGAATASRCTSPIPTDNPWVPLRILAAGEAPAGSSASPTSSCSPTSRPSLLHGAGLLGGAERAGVRRAARRPAHRRALRMGARTTAWLTYGKVDARVAEMTLRPRHRRPMAERRSSRDTGAEQPRICSTPCAGRRTSTPGDGPSRSRTDARDCGRAWRDRPGGVGRRKVEEA